MGCMQSFNLKGEDDGKDDGTGKSPGADKGNAKLGEDVVFGYQTDIKSKYKLGSELGRGQFGVTLAARRVDDASDKTEYAVKTIKKKILTSEEAVEDVRREVKIMEELKDQPNVVHLFEVFEDRQTVYIVMECANGGELFDRIIEKGQFTEKEAATYVRQILKVVAQCHLKGIIHRDLKPENFLFKTKKHDKSAPPLEDDLKATDFGLSDFFNEGQIFNEVVGSAYYVAPEVLRRRYGPAADVWSVGVIVYICLCGQPPFWGQTETAIFNEILKGRVNFSSPPWPRISNSAKNLISRMLTMDTRNRITAAQALSHPWVRADGDAPEVPIDISVISHMKKFVGAGKLKKIFMQSVASTYGEDDVRVLRDQFLSIDKDGSGTITIDEMRTVLKEQKGQKRTAIGDAEIENILKSMDLDGDGVIDYMEFVSATLAATALTRGEKEAYKRHVRLAFNNFDKDGNGYIEASELMAAIGKDDHIAELIKEADKNGDGMIDYSEFFHLLVQTQKQ